MLKSKASILVLVISLLSGCGGSKYSLEGNWKSECFADNRGKNFREDLYFSSDNNFEKRIHIRYRGKNFSFHSGKYKIMNNKLELTYTESDFPSFSSKPVTETMNVDWLDINTIRIVDKSTKCNAYRQTSSS